MRKIIDYVHKLSKIFSITKKYIFFKTIDRVLINKNATLLTLFNSKINLKVNNKIFHQS